MLKLLTEFTNETQRIQRLKPYILSLSEGLRIKISPTADPSISKLFQCPFSGNEPLSCNGELKNTFTEIT